jgi:hypothetical protein
MRWFTRIEPEEVVHGVLVPLQGLRPEAQMGLAGVGDGVHPARRTTGTNQFLGRPPISKVFSGVLPGGVTFARFGFTLGTVLSLSSRKHTGMYPRR